MFLAIQIYFYFVVFKFHFCSYIRYFCGDFISHLLIPATFQERFAETKPIVHRVRHVRSVV